MGTDRLPVINSVVVTGASSGIGEACALCLDKLGFRVFAGVRREADSGALKRKASDRLTPIFLDVTDAASIAAAVDVVAAAVGEAGLSGLVNNAGIVMAGPLEFLPVDKIYKQFEVNVIGQIAVTQAFLPLIRQGHGRIINIGSLAGRVAMPFIGAYSASKFAMEALTDSLRVELRPWNIRVSLIEPNFISTPIWEKSKVMADDMVRNLPQQGQDLYATTISAVRDIYYEIGKKADPAEAVAKLVVHALTAKRPKTRYLVGKGARLEADVFRHLPDRLRDFLISSWVSILSRS